MGIGLNPNDLMLSLNNSISHPIRNFFGENWGFFIALLIFISITLFIASCRIVNMKISNPNLQIRIIKMLAGLLLLPLILSILFISVFWFSNLLIVNLHKDGYQLAEMFTSAFYQTAVFSSLGLIAGICCWISIGYFLEPWLSKKFALKFSEDGLSDIRTLSETQFKDISFDAAAAAAKDKGEVLLGIDENGKSIGIHIKEFISKNFQIVGAPGSGKGVFAQQIFGQIYDYVLSVVFDPKCDPYLTAFFQQKGKCCFIDLRDDKPQINLFAGCTKTEVADSLIEAIRLREKGAESDVYSIEEAEVIERLIDQVSDFEFSTIAEVATEHFSDARKLVPRLRSISRLGALKGEKSLLQLMNTHKSFYLIFDESSEIQKLVARIIYSRIQQFKKTKKIKRHITILADEFFHLVSKTTVDSLGLMRSRGINALVCHQSLGDFIGQFGDVDSKAAKQRTLDNTHIKIIYRQQQDAEFWSLQTGKKVFEDVMREAEKSDLGADLEGSQGRISVKQRATIDENEFLSLGKSVAVLIGHGIAQKIKTIPPKVELCDFKIKACPQNEDENQQKTRKNNKKPTIDGDSL